MVAEYEEHELAEDSSDEKRFEKEERTAEKKSAKKRKGSSKGRVLWATNRYRSVSVQQCALMAQW